MLLGLYCMCRDSNPEEPAAPVCFHRRQYGDFPPLGTTWAWAAWSELKWWYFEDVECVVCPNDRFGWSMLLVLSAPPSTVETLEFSENGVRGLVSSRVASSAVGLICQ